MTPMQYIIAGLCMLLALSLAGNGFFWHERDGLIQKEATVQQLQADTAAAAATCTMSVQNLAKAGKTRDDRMVTALNAIAPRVAADQAAALKALQERPDNPADLCGSLERFFRRSIEAERATTP